LEKAHERAVLYMTKKKETAKGEKSKKKQRAEQQPAKPEVSKWQEFLRRHNKSEKKD